MNILNPCQQRFYDSRQSQGCQTILYQAVFEHFPKVENIAVLVAASSSFRNSSLAPNFLLNFKVDDESIRLFDRILTPSSCFSLQFVTSLAIDHELDKTVTGCRAMEKFFDELVTTKYFASNITSLELNDSGILRNLFGNSISFPKLCSLFLACEDVDETMMALIAASAPHLTTLKLPGCNVSDLGLEQISTLSELKTLGVGYNGKITEAGLKAIAKLGNLTTLDLSSCVSITDAGLAHFPPDSKIGSLSLSGSRLISDVGLEHLSKLSGITSLYLNDCRMISDAGLEQISKLPDLTSLSLVWCSKITDAGIEHICKLSTITDLNLSRCSAITDVGLEHISKLAGITTLNLVWCTQITVEAKKKFMNALPNCDFNG